MPAFSERDMEDLYDAYFRDGRRTLKCPEDQAALEIPARPSFRAGSRPFLSVRCPLCGRSGQKGGDPFSDVPDYTPEELQDVATEFFRNGRSRCPDDRAPLEISKQDAMGGAVYLTGFCYWCGRTLSWSRAAE